METEEELMIIRTVYVFKNNQDLHTTTYLGEFLKHEVGEIIYLDNKDSAEKVPDGKYEICKKLYNKQHQTLDLMYGLKKIERKKKRTLCSLLRLNHK